MGKTRFAEDLLTENVQTQIALGLGYTIVASNSGWLLLLSNSDIASTED